MTPQAALFRGHNRTIAREYPSDGQKISFEPRTGDLCSGHGSHHGGRRLPLRVTSTRAEAVRGRISRLEHVQPLDQERGKVHHHHDHDGSNRPRSRPTADDHGDHGDVGHRHVEQEEWPEDDADRQDGGQDGAVHPYPPIRASDDLDSADQVRLGHDVDHLAPLDDGVITVQATQEAETSGHPHHDDDKPAAEHHHDDGASGHDNDHLTPGDDDDHLTSGHNNDHLTSGHDDHNVASGHHDDDLTPGHDNDADPTDPSDPSGHLTVRSACPRRAETRTDMDGINGAPTPMCPGVLA
jgi:hypothetical protein